MEEYTIFNLKLSLYRDYQIDDSNSSECCRDQPYYQLWEHCYLFGTLMQYFVHWEHNKNTAITTAPSLEMSKLPTNKQFTKLGK